MSYMYVKHNKIQKQTVEGAQYGLETTLHVKDLSSWLQNKKKTHTHTQKTIPKQKKV